MVQQGLLAEIRGGGLLPGPVASMQAAGAKAMAASTQIDADGFSAELRAHLQLGAVKIGKGTEGDGEVPDSKAAEDPKAAKKLEAATGLKAAKAPGTADVVNSQVVTAKVVATMSKAPVKTDALLNVVPAQPADEQAETALEPVVRVAAPKRPAIEVRAEEDAAPEAPALSPAEALKIVSNAVAPGKAVESERPAEQAALARPAVKADKPAEPTVVKSSKSSLKTVAMSAPELQVAASVPAQVAASQLPISVVVNLPLPPPDAKQEDKGEDQVAALPTIARPSLQKKAVKELAGAAATSAANANVQAAAGPTEVRHEAAAARAEQAKAPAEAVAKTQDVGLAAAPVSSGAPHTKPSPTVAVGSTPTHAVSAESVAHGRWQEPEIVRTLASTPKVLEVGLSAGGHGWLRVRAEAGDAGEITASLVAASSGQAEDLRRKLPGISEYLASESVGVSSLVVNAGSAAGGAPDSTMSFAGGAAAGGRGQEGQQARTGEERAGAVPGSDAVPIGDERTDWSHAARLVNFNTNRSGGWLSVLA